MYKYLFFDLDGTLTQSEFGIINSITYALDQMGIKVDDRESVKRFIGPELGDKSYSKDELVAAAIKEAAGDNEINLADYVMIGDRFYDIDGANANSIDSIGVLYGYGKRDELEKAGATHIAETTEDILKVKGII